MSFWKKLKTKVKEKVQDVKAAIQRINLGLFGAAVGIIGGHNGIWILGIAGAIVAMALVLYIKHLTGDAAPIEEVPRIVP